MAKKQLRDDEQPIDLSPAALEAARAAMERNRALVNAGQTYRSQAPSQWKRSFRRPNPK